MSPITEAHSPFGSLTLAANLLVAVTICCPIAANALATMKHLSLADGFVLTLAIGLLWFAARGLAQDTPIGAPGAGQDDLSAETEVDGAATTA